ncbi:MAG: aldehyde dehydrogenase family protein [Gemmatimonadaceae bacterium]|nr:aldehyde dehydrogenase family protein [Gemmatimonadaceae bacterium]
MTPASGGFAAAASKEGGIPVRERYEHFIGGAFSPPASGRYFSNHDPSTGEPFGAFARGDAVDVRRAVEDAAAGQSAWMAMRPAARGQVMLAIASRIRRDLDALAWLESLDSGKALWLSRLDVETCARYFEYFGGVADKILGEVIPASNEHLMYMVREPFGVTAHIIPWNAPITQAGRGAGPALAAGNAVVMKPAEETCVTTLELARICVEAGLPPGAFNVITGYGEEAGQALTSDAGIRKIAFTGSVETGRRVMKAAADRVVPVTVELGGKSPFVVFDDADLDSAASLARKAFVLNAGQICSAGTRLLVQRRCVPAFVERLTRELDKVRIGPGVEDPDIGPVVSEQQRQRVERYIEIGRAEGARLAYGGYRPADSRLRGGYYVAPTLFVDVANSMTIAQEEIFGPVGCVIPFGDEEEAVRIANDTQYGLAAGVWTRDVARSHRVAGRIQAGQVYVNDYQPIGVEAPFGGYKNSGYGREKGLEALHHYTQTKTIIVRTAPDGATAG